MTLVSIPCTLYPEGVADRPLRIGERFIKFTTAQGEVHAVVQEDAHLSNDKRFLVNYLEKSADMTLVSVDPNIELSPGIGHTLTIFTKDTREEKD